MGIRKYKTENGQWRYGVNVYNKWTGETRWVGTFKNADEAKLAFSEADSSIRRGDTAPVRREIALDDLVEKYLERLSVADDTRTEYARTLARLTVFFGGKRKVTTLSREDMEDLVVAAIREGMNARAARKLMTRVSQLMNAAIDWGYISTSPAAGRIRSLPPMPETPVRPLSPDEVRALIEATPEYWRTAILTCVACGLRRGELFGLLIEDVDLEAATVSVRGQLKKGVIERTKTPAGVRVIAIPNVVVTALRNHIARAPTTEQGLLFPTQRGRPVLPSNWYRRVWRPAVIASGLRPDLKLHDLRRQFASVLVRQGRSAAYLQAVMGHRSAVTTLKYYVGKFDDEAAQATKDMNDWLVEESSAAYAA